MFDYQAGEKYKLTLVMVAIAGLLAGLFFSFIIMPPPEAPKRRATAKHLTDPDVTGMRTANGSAQATPSQSAVAVVDPYQAKTLIDNWLPLAWDLSAGTAKSSQDRAMSLMTPECAIAYRKNIWTEELSQQIDQSGIKSSFIPTQISVGEVMSDGSVNVLVKGTQTLGVPGRGSRNRNVSLEYLIIQTTDGMRIASFTESGADTRR
jgi:hypothetical protein